MKSIQKNIKRLQIALVSALVLAVTPAFATSITLVDEDFNDVTYSSSTASIRTVKNILDNNPGQLPYGTTWDSSNAQENNVNVRRANNTINTGTNTGFDSFFTPAISGNKFLVLGDNEGTIGGEPYGGTMRVALPFIFPSGAHSLNLSFDYAFDGTSRGTVYDYFRVFIANDKPVELNHLLDLLELKNPGFAFGTLSTEISGEDLPSNINLFLVFELQEYTPDTDRNKTNTAVGIDNIHVTATAPEPSSFLLLGAGLMSFGILARRYRKKG